MKKIVLVLVLCLVGCDSRKESDEVFAVIDGQKILSAEVDGRVQEELLDAQTRIYQLRRQAIDEIVQEKLVAAEAAKKGVTVEALWKEFETSKNKEIKNSDIEEYIKSKGLSPKGDDKLSKETILGIIRVERIFEAKEKFLATLRSQSKFEMKLPKPVFHRVEVGTGGIDPLGNPKAKVKIVMFSDFQCPFCAQAEELVKDVLEKYGESVVIYYRHFPLQSLHPQAFRSAEASICAQDQGLFWKFHDVLFSEQSQLSEKSKKLDLYLETAFSNIGGDLKIFSACLKSGKHKVYVETDILEGQRVGVSGTPTFFVNGLAVLKSTSSVEMFQLIDNEL